MHTIMYNWDAGFLRSMKYRLEPLAKALGPELLHTVTADQLRAMQKGAPVSRNNIRRYYLMLWGWALREHHAHTNAAAALTVAQADESLPQALTLHQVKALLRVTREKQPALMPWLCVGLFAGLRIAELARVSQAYFRGGKLHLDPTVTKLRDRRILDCTDIQQHPDPGAIVTLYPPSPEISFPVFSSKTPSPVPFSVNENRTSVGSVNAT